MILNVIPPTILPTNTIDYIIETYILLLQYKSYVVTIFVYSNEGSIVITLALSQFF